MNKAQLVENIAAEMDCTKADAGRFIDSFIGEVLLQMKAGGEITLVGFGSFSVKDRAARKGINPKTKEPIDIPASRVVSFKASAALKEAANAKPASKAKAKK